MNVKLDNGVILQKQPFKRWQHKKWDELCEPVRGLLKAQPKIDLSFNKQVIDMYDAIAANEKAIAGEEEGSETYKALLLEREKLNDMMQEANAASRQEDMRYNEAMITWLETYKAVNMQAYEQMAYELSGKKEEQTFADFQNTIEIEDYPKIEEIILEGNAPWEALFVRNRSARPSQSGVTDEAKAN